MTFSLCLSHHLQLATKPGYEIKSPIRNQLIQTVSRRQPSIQQDGKLGLWLRNDPCFVPKSRSIIQPNLIGSTSYRKNSRVVVLCFEPSQIASSVFTIGTAGVLPFYTLMVVAPRAKLTRISMKSYVPYIVLGVLYAYLLYLSWSPDTLLYMFGNTSSYYLPELSGMLKMFSNDMTLASAWIHLLAIDLFAARQIYHDGLQNDIETRHSVSLCLLFCPIGVLTHVITKSLSNKQKNRQN